MTKISIKSTQNQTILKFELQDFITKNKSYEFKNIDEATVSPLAQQLFYLPFVKTVFIAGNFIAIERYNIVDWNDVKDAVAEQIEDYIDKGGIIINETSVESKKQPITIYAETTPNPSVLKFVANKMLTSKTAEFKNIDEAFPSTLAKELFKFSFVKEIFMDENYISITKHNSFDWQEVSNEVRMFIKEYIENGNEIINESLLISVPKNEKQTNSNFDSLDATSQQIINILEEYVKPAVQADGGNILFDSYDENDKRVKVVLQGACSGCPSSTFTLKNGIENMLKDMLKDESIKVEAINA
ncbi:NifU family protein [Flavobacterium sp.]|uniref:NifU family protein n=1 Tax=Flavobacterium sp. TaxID=239 RepID=UPI003528171A